MSALLSLGALESGLLALVVLGIGLAGGLGAVIRLFAGQITGWLPWGILAANITASFVVGLAQQSAFWVLGFVLVNGFAGGLSTFSAFVAQTGGFIRGRNLLQAAVNTLATLALSSTGFWLGQLLGTALLK